MAKTLERARMTTARALCADVSNAHAEPLGATASRVENWILVEYRRLWGRDPLAGSGLADEIKAHLRAQLREVSNSRLLFIRRPNRRHDPRLAVFYGRSLETEQTFSSVEIGDYEELLDLDFTVSGSTPLTHPLFVVCTHGKRDRCCAKYGRPLYEELRDQTEPEWVWQSTHVGGDRFAGNVVCLPQGLYFGRVERPYVWPLVEDVLDGRIPLEHYRGRSCYPFVVQAAELRLRRETGLTGFDDVRLAETIRHGETSWTVRLRTGDGALHEVDVATELGEPTYLTCSAPLPQTPRRHVATAHRVLLDR